MAGRCEETCSFQTAETPATRSVKWIYGKEWTGDVLGNLGCIQIEKALARQGYGVLLPQSCQRGTTKSFKQESIMRVWWSDKAYGDQTGACCNVWREGDATIKAMGMKEGARED